jgi:hypothetical protein
VGDQQAEQSVTRGEACARFVSDSDARKLREGSLLKYRHAVKALKSLADDPLQQVSDEDIRRLGSLEDRGHRDAEAARNSAITLQVLRRIGMVRNECRRGSEGSDVVPNEIPRSPYRGGRTRVGRGARDPTIPTLSSRHG